MKLKLKFKDHLVLSLLSGLSAKQEIQQSLLEKVMTKLSEVEGLLKDANAKLDASNAQFAKALGEITDKLQDLETELQDVELSEGAADALAALTSTVAATANAAQQLDDVVPDAEVPPQPEPDPAPAPVDEVDPTEGPVV